MKRRLLRRAWRLVWFPWELGGGDAPWGEVPWAPIVHKIQTPHHLTSWFKYLSHSAAVTERLVRLGMGFGTVVEGRW